MRALSAVLGSKRKAFGSNKTVGSVIVRLFAWRCSRRTYHGVLAPASSWRSEIVPASPARRQHASGSSGVLPLHRYSFAELMKRVFRIDVLKCATCGAERLWIAAITNADTLAKIQDHLELPSVASQLAPPSWSLGSRDVES
ncbi:MAG: hypothetical protein ACI9F9_002505 [Candidatus Paceibacteria bacterium]|jgi:hypothetical protein